LPKQTVTVGLSLIIIIVQFGTISPLETVQFIALSFAYGDEWG